MFAVVLIIPKKLTITSVDLNNSLLLLGKLRYYLFERVAIFAVLVHIHNSYKIVRLTLNYRL
jgi:hypothetical protein